MPPTAPPLFPASGAAGAGAAAAPAASSARPLPEGPPGALRAGGAPRDQGIAQGRAWAGPIARWLAAERARRGALARWDLAFSARPARAALAAHLVQIHERWEGIALGAGAPLPALTAPWAALRLAGRAELAEGALALRLVLPPALEALALVRRSEPDAAGFASLELALAPFPGCLAGVNECGVAVAVLEERGALEIPTSALAQDFLLRASDLAAGLEHLQLRARYAGGSGALLAADASGAAQQVTLERGRCELRPAPRALRPTPHGLRIELAARRMSGALGSAELTAH